MWSLVKYSNYFKISLPFSLACIPDSFVVCLCLTLFNTLSLNNNYTCSICSAWFLDIKNLFDICDWLWENPPLTHKDDYLEKRN